MGCPRRLTSDFPPLIRYPVNRAALLVCSLWLSACGTQAQNLHDNMFKVLGSGCRAREFVQSGFRTTIDREVGIVTTLHGVIGCRAVSAESEAEHVSGLYLSMVDVSRDVAFLTSDALRTDRSLRAAAGPSSIARAEAVAIGDLATSDQLTLLADRGSPRPEIVVFRPSTSRPDFGAPVLDAAGSIIGVENGLAGEAGVVGWVIAYQSIDWIPPVQDETQVDRLASLSTPLW